MDDLDRDIAAIRDAASVNVDRFGGPAT